LLSLGEDDFVLPKEVFFPLVVKGLTILSTRENPEVLIKEQLKLSQSLVFKELTFVSEPESEGLVSEEGRKKKK